MRRLQLLALVLLAAGMFAVLNAVPAAHADEGELSVSIVSVDDSEFPVVRVVINVDAGDRPLEGLIADQVEATEGGVAVPVQSVEPAFDSKLPIALMLVIDTSGSVEGDLIGEVQSAATELIGELGPRDEVAVIAFADEVSVVQTLTTDHEAAIAAVEGLEAFGNTALYDAVGVAAALAAAADVPRSAVVLLSDGAEYGGFSAATRESSLRDIEGGAPFYVIGVGAWVDLEYLGEVATSSEGRYFSAESVLEIGSVYVAIEELLRSQYVVTLESAVVGSDSESELVLTVTSDGQSAVAMRTYTTHRPVALVADPIATPVAVEQPAPQPVEVAAPVAVPAAEPGDFPTRLALGAVGVLLVALIGAAFMKRRRAHTSGLRVAPSVVDRRPLRAITMEQSATRSGYLVPLAVAGVDTEVPLGQGPITIGSADDCRPRVEASAEVAGQHARIWERDGRPMLHHVADGFETRVNGNAVGWAVLVDGDEIAVGPYSFRFVSQLDGESAAPREVSA